MPAVALQDIEGVLEDCRAEVIAEGDALVSLLNDRFIQILHDQLQLFLEVDDRVRCNDDVLVVEEEVEGGEAQEN